MNLITRAIPITCIAALLLSGGCSVANPFAPANSTTAVPTIPAIHLAYTTPSDRLNVLVGGPTVNQFASTGQPRPGMLPSVTESTLEVIHPHPQGHADLAQVVLHVGVEGSLDASAGTWLLDIPAWQVDGIMKRLRAEKFFRRAKVLESEVEMSVTQDGDNFRKRFRAIPELDALVLRAFREGRTLSTAQSGSSRLPLAQQGRQQPGAQHWPVSQQASPRYR